MNKLLGLLMISCYLFSGVELSKLSEQMTEEDIKSLNNLMASMTKNMTKLNRTNVLQLDTDTSITIQTYMKTYYEKHCHARQPGQITPATLQGTISDNSITFTETINEFTGKITISPDPNLQGFNVDFGLSDYTNGFQIHFNDNHMKCKTNDDIVNIDPIKGELCVQSYSLKRATGGTVKGCFVVGGALLTSQYYDINTINSVNAMTAAVIDFGCYSATNTVITQTSNSESDSNSTLTTALGAIVKPLHAQICNSASLTSPFLLPVFILLTLKSILSY